MTTATSTVAFLATIPLLQSAIQVSGDGGLRLKLDVPESEMDAAVGLLTLRGQVLRVTVAPEKQATTGNGTDKDKLAEGRQRKPRWSATEKPSADGAPGESGQPSRRVAQRGADSQQALAGARPVGVSDDTPGHTARRADRATGAGGVVRCRQVHLRPDRRAAEAAVWSGLQQHDG